MNPTESRKRRSKSNRAAGDSSGLAAVVGGAPDPRAPAISPVAAAATGATLAPDANGALGASGRPAPHAPSSGFPAVGAHAAGAWWPAASPGSSDGMYPPDGFVNYLQSANIPLFPQPHPFVNYQNGSQLPENFHFVGGPMSHCSMSQTAPYSEWTPSPTGSSPVDDAQMGLQEKETIDVEEDDTIQPATSDVRSDRRLNWSNEEDIRLVSAWLHNSIDPVDGNGKKADQYWADVAATYNSTTKSNRMRNRNQLKLRWERIKKPVAEFNGCYSRITKVHQSGMSDDQKMDDALQLYASEHEEKPFTMVHIWRIVRHEKKWSAIVKKFNKEKDNSATLNPAHVVNVEDSPKQRPIGHKKAKDERNGKKKQPEAISAIGEKLDKFIQASTKAEKMAEVQQSLADKKIEVAKLAHKTAQEQTKVKMLDLYKDLLCAPTSDLSEEAMAERSKALECMRLALFAKDS